MLDFGRADAEGECAEGAVGAGVAVAADDGGAGEREALLGADDMDDALAQVVHREILDAEFGAVGGEGGDLDAGGFVFDAFEAVRRGGDVVVGDG